MYVYKIWDTEEKTYFGHNKLVYEKASHAKNAVIKNFGWQLFNCLSNRKFIDQDRFEIHKFKLVREE